jgi:hypothetical protein
MITGQHLPQRHRPSSALPAGTIVTTGDRMPSPVDAGHAR